MIDAFAPDHPKEVEISRFRGHYYASAAAGIVSFDEPKFGAHDQLPADLIVGAANVAMDAVPIEGMTWLDQYDAYYYDRDGALSLPVLRVRYPIRSRRGSTSIRSAARSRGKRRG